MSVALSASACPVVRMGASEGPLRSLSADLVCCQLGALRLSALTAEQ